MTTLQHKKTKKQIHLKLMITEVFLKILITTVGALVVLTVASFIVFYLHNVEAQTYTPAVGPGWIKFSSESLNGAAADVRPYGVFVNSDGLLMGEAWSDNYGWLSFNQSDLVNCPTAPCQATFNGSTGELGGWAKFIGMDSWVSLRGTVNVVSLPTPVSKIALFLRKTVPPVASLFDLLNAQAQTGYGVSFNPSTNPGKISGVAWGNNAGWIVFGNPATPTQQNACANCSVAGQLLNQPPTASNVQVGAMPTNSLWCDPSPYYQISWVYSDPDGNLQASAKIDFIQVNDPTQVYTVTMTGGNSIYNFQDPLANLVPNTDYQAWVTVNDGTVNSLAPAGSTVFKTPPHYYPLVNLSFTPNPFSTPSIVNFTTDAQARAHGAPGPFAWHWTFSNAGASRPNADAQNVSVLVQKFPSVATSTITDADGHSCSGSLDLGTGGPGSNIKRRIFKEL